MSVGRKWISTAAGVLASGLAASALAQSPAAPTGANQNQATAEAVAATLRTSPALAGHRIEVQTRDGQAVLSGVVATPAQHSEAISRVLRVRGVAGVVDHIKVSNDPRVVPAQYQMARGGTIPNLGNRAMGAPMAGAPMAGAPMAGAPAGLGGGTVVGNGTAPGMGGTIVSDSGPISSDAAAMMEGPAPEGPAGGVSGTQASLPGQPNYAWPSTAPYPNFSAVGYPTAYPWQAWPNIGPPYPYPEVPLDWRAVTLRWDDGIWWLDFKKHYTRPFFTPYPFGIFAY